MEGSVFSNPVPGITIGCISPEARDLLDTVMEEWAKHIEDEHKMLPADKVDSADHYRFAYWLIRWSGLVRPNK